MEQLLDIVDGLYNLLQEMVLLALVAGTAFGYFLAKYQQYKEVVEKSGSSSGSCCS